jgi:hypothetical protein
MKRVLASVSAAARLFAAGAFAYGAVKSVERGGLFFDAVVVVLGLLALASLTFACLRIDALWRDPVL